mgnify:CR=1 FL=1
MAEMLNVKSNCYGWVNPYGNRNCDIFLNTEGKIMNTTLTSWVVSNNIDSPRIVNLTAAGLQHSDIEVKEVDGQLTVKTKSGLTGHYTNLNQTYNLKNVKLNSLTLKLGVLTLEFVDTENVLRHTIKEA